MLIKDGRNNVEAIRRIADRFFDDAKICPQMFFIRSF